MSYLAHKGEVARLPGSTQLDRATPCCPRHELFLFVVCMDLFWQQQATGKENGKLFIMHIRTMTHNSPCFLDLHCFVCFWQQLHSLIRRSRLDLSEL